MAEKNEAETANSRAVPQSPGGVEVSNREAPTALPGARDRALKAVADVCSIPPEQRCYCGWWLVGDCPHCPKDRTCADKLHDRGNALPSSVCQCIDAANRAAAVNKPLPDLKSSLHSAPVGSADDNASLPDWPGAPKPSEAAPGAKAEEPERVCLKCGTPTKDGGRLTCSTCGQILPAPAISLPPITVEPLTSSVALAHSAFKTPVLTELAKDEGERLMFLATVKTWLGHSKETGVEHTMVPNWAMERIISELGGRKEALQKRKENLRANSLDVRDAAAGER